MQIENFVGQLQVGDGIGNVKSRGGRQGDLMVSELHGPCYEQAYRGNMFAVANQAAVTTTAALATTFTGLSVANPATSGVNLEMLLFTCAQFAVGAASAVGWMTGVGAAAGSLTPRNRIVGGAASKAIASAGSTLGGTPVLDQVVGQVGSLATTGYGLTPGLVAPMAALIVPPGAFVASFTSIVTTSALLFGFAWVEVPI